MNTEESDSQNTLLAPLATIPAGQRRNGDTDWFPAVDVLEDAQEYLFRIDLPDVRPENIRIVVEDNGLFISGERPQPAQDQQQCLRIERPYGHFERRFALPDNADSAAIEPLFREGVLELRVRKTDFVAEPPVPPHRGPKLRLRSTL